MIDDRGLNVDDRGLSVDDRGLSGKVAIVTGGGAAGDGIGNGRAMAMLLARGGTRVLVVDRKQELAERTVKMIESEGGSAATFVGDVTSESQCRAMVETAVTRFGRLDFLANNVGIELPGFLGKPTGPAGDKKPTPPPDSKTS